MLNGLWTRDPPPFLAAQDIAHSKLSRSIRAPQKDVFLSASAGLHVSSVCGELGSVPHEFRAARMDGGRDHLQLRLQHTEAQRLPNQLL